MGKSTISMAIFNSFLYVYQRVAPKKKHETTEDDPPKSTGELPKS